jgi:hypothetical protein
MREEESLSTKGPGPKRSGWWEWVLIIPEFILSILAFFWESGPSENN